MVRKTKPVGWVRQDDFDQQINDEWGKACPSDFASLREAFIDWAISWPAYLRWRHEQKIHQIQVRQSRRAGDGK